MLKIKVSKENAGKIEAALKEINGKAAAHTYTNYDQIESMAKQAEKELAALLLKKDWPGATWRETSGNKVANCYKGSRIATKVKLLRGSNAWFLVNVSTASVWNEGGGAGRLGLTKAQEIAAQGELKNKYYINE